MSSTQHTPFTQTLSRWGKRIASVLPAHSRLAAFFALLCFLLPYYGGRLLNSGLLHHDLGTAIDAAIPTVPWTITVYYLSYLFWFINYLLAARRDEEHAFRFFCADFLAKVTCLLCFIVFPTATVRPPVQGDSFWCFLLRGLYQIDSPDNLFPSMHCLSSVLATLGIASEKRIPLWYRVGSFVFTAAICVSTLTTKQHWIADVISGVTLGAAAYLIAGIRVVRNGYRLPVLKLQRRLGNLLTKRPANDPRSRG